MGAKTGYSDAILALAGLEPGDKAGHYLWCEPDDGVRLLLHAYRDADLAREAARIIRSWADEEPRALWERLRAEGPARCPPVYALAEWAALQGGAVMAFPITLGEAPARKVTLDPNRAPGRGCWPKTTGEALATQGGLPATIHDDATTLDPREVARLTMLGQWSYRRGEPESGFNNGVQSGKAWNALAPETARRVHDAGGLPATIHDDATTAPIPDPLPEGTLVYIDPPYVGTTGYAHDLDRPAVVRLAQQWAAAGARVMISEAVPIDALVACGWHAVEVSAMRVGQKRTFSKQQREWVTTSFQPDRRAVRACELAAERAERAAAVMAGGEQRDLFGGAA